MAKKKKSAIRKHFSKMGFTNRLAVYIMFLLGLGLIAGFYLAIKSIDASYTGALVCYTAIMAPVGTACSVVLSRVVDKNRDENTSKDGDGIAYAYAAAKNFIDEADGSPPI